MRVTVDHTVYWGGPCHGRIIYDPWPFDHVPSTGETVVVGSDDDGAETVDVKHVLWIPDEAPCVQVRTHGWKAESDDHAREMVGRLRAVGFDFGPPYPFER